MAVVTRRLLAYLIDVALLFVLLAPLGWLAQRLAGFAPETGPQVWVALLLGFSLPTWTWFTACDASARGATPGKRWLGLRIVRCDGARVAWPQALARTALKLLPWELAHLFAFGLSPQIGEFTPGTTAGLIAANAIALAWLASALATRGRSSVHDRLAGTCVTAAAPPPTPRDASS